MITSFLCTTAEIPPGFEPRRPAKRDLLRGTVVVFAGSDAEGREILAGYEDRARGALVTTSGSVAVRRIGNMLWHVSILDVMVPHTRSMLEGFVEAIALGETHYERNVLLGTEVERLRDVLGTTRQHYNLVTDRLREQLVGLERMEAALRESEQDLAFTLDSIGDGVVATDADGRVRRMNPVAEDLTGFPRHEAVGRPLCQIVRLIDSQTRAPLEDVVTRVQAEGRIDGLVGQTLLVSKAGSERSVSHSIAPRRGPGGARSGVVVVLRDVTEHLQLEEHVRQVQRMDALGQLAGGVAHDFNNVLGGMLAFCDLLRLRVGNDAKALGYVEAVIKAAERAAGLTRQLLAFARKSRGEKRPVDVHRIIDDSLQLASRTFDRRITVETKLTPEKATILGDPSLVQTVLINLLVNARDALPHGGRITVSTTPLEVDERVRVADLAPGSYVCVTVEDTGEGIPKDILGRVFEPFFTTKGPDKGTGLGLAAVYGILRDLGGGVEIASAVGRGTTVRLYFPTVGEEEEAPPPSRARPGNANLRLLLVEDDALVRAPVSEGLRDLGYTVIEAKNGAEAVALVAAEPRGFDLVMLDMNMPVMNGRDALVGMKRHAPGLPIIVLSGYLTDAEVEQLKRLGATRCIAKPFRLTDLSQELSLVLGAAARRR
jgi:PAS domain S-box-containing protein